MHIQNGFETFEQTVTDVLNEAQHYSFKISHELNVPIRTIKSHMEKLSHTLPLDQNEDMLIIHQSVNRMQEMADKILLLSKIQKIDLEPEFVDVKEQILDIIEEQKIKHPIEYTFELKTLVPLFGDPLLLRMMWHNLISNSLKYHNKDEKCHMVIHSTFDKNITVYTFSDNGPGFSEDAYSIRNNLMNDCSNKIGLNLIGEIIKKHNGKFTILKSDNTGTTFEIQLPSFDKTNKT